VRRFARAFFFACALRRFIFIELRLSCLPMGPRKMDPSGEAVKRGKPGRNALPPLQAHGDALGRGG
jgi:hypothetical protein